MICYFVVLLLVEVQAETPVVMAARVAVRDGQWEVALAYADISARSLSATHFLDDDRLCALEAALMQVCVPPFKIVCTPIPGVKFHSDEFVNHHFPHCIVCLIVLFAS